MGHKQQAIHLRNELRFRIRRRVAGAMVVGLVGSVMALLGFFSPLLSGPSPAAADGSAGRARPAVHVVEPGDTLWAIAVAAHPHADPRPYVDRMSAELHGRVLQAGESIEVP